MFMNIAQNVLARVLVQVGGSARFPKAFGGIDGGAVDPSIFSGRRMGRGAKSVGMRVLAGLRGSGGPWC